MRSRTEAYDDAESSRASSGPAPDSSTPTPGSHWWQRLPFPVEVMILGLLAAFTRLVAISHPKAIVFDEVYFREYALRYLDGTYYFDLHPPLGKLILGSWAKLIGTAATADGTDPAVALRIIPALAGVALIVVMYYFLRELGASRKVSTFAAALLLMDNAILVESRLILLDSMLLFFGIAAVTFYLASRRLEGTAHWVTFCLGALFAGLALSTKWTGLTALGLIGLVWLVTTLNRRVSWRQFLPEAAALFLIPAFVYVSAWGAHFALLPNSGPEGDAYMSQEFQATLKGNQFYDPDAAMGLSDKIVEINGAITRYEHSLNDSTHPYQSTFTSWPLMQRGIYYWVSEEEAGSSTHEYIYLLGNPLLWWGVLLALLVVAVGWVWRPEAFRKHWGAFAILGVGWAMNYLPFSTIVRPMFLYHYFFALIYTIAAASLGIGILAGWQDEDEKRPWAFRDGISAALYVGILVVVLFGFLYFLPLTYGLPLTDSGLNARMWLSTWR